MSVQYILNSDYNTIKNEKLTQALEVSTSLKAPLHYVDDIALSKTLAGKLNVSSVVLATQLEAPIGVINTVNVEDLVPASGVDGTVDIAGAISSVSDTQSVLKNLKVNKLEAYTNGNGTAGQVLSLDSNLDLLWKNDANDVAQWSTFPAVQNVDLDYHELQNATVVTTEELNINGYNIVKGNSTHEPSLNSLIFSPPANYDYVSFGNSTNACNLELVGDGSIIVPSGSVQANSLKVLNPNGDHCGHFDNAGLRIYDTATASQLKFNLDEATSVARLPYINRDLNSCVIYVVPNTNVSGIENGTMEGPYNSIQTAVNWINSNHDNKYWTVSIAPGTYTDTFNIQYPNISFVGTGNSFFSATQTILTNQVSISVPVAYVGNLHGHQLSFENLYFNNTMNNNCVGDVCINIKNCYFYVNTTAYTDALLVSTQSRLRFIDCNVIGTNAINTSPLIDVRQGMVACSQTQFETAGNNACLSLSTNAVVDVIANCKFTSNKVGSTQPLVDITANVSGSYSFVNCGFVYANASTNACAGIYSHPSSGSNNVVVLYCSFYMTGLAAGPTNYCVRSSNSVVLYFSNNALVGYASLIQGSQGVSKFSMTAVS